MENKVVLKLRWRPIHTFWCMGKYNMKRGKGIFWVFSLHFHLSLFLPVEDAREEQLLYSQDGFKEAISWSKG